MCLQLHFIDELLNKPLRDRQHKNFYKLVSLHFMCEFMEK